MGHPGEASRRAKPDVLSASVLHRQLNPVAGLSLLVGIDQGTGQLFFTAAKGLCRDRDRRRSESGEAKLYEEWQQRRQSR